MSAQNPHSRPATAARRAQTVVVIDDDPELLTLLSTQLRRADLDVRATTDPLAALGHLTTATPVVVVTDWAMPGMDGLELLQRIRAAPELGPRYCIMLTSLESNGDLAAALAGGADDFVRKPFKAEEFIARVEHGFRVLELQRELVTRTQEAVRYAAELNLAHRKLAQFAATDDLTGLLNRRAGLERLAGVWAAAERHSDELCVLLGDLDDFKRINDTFGHDVGDDVLAATADALRRRARKSDFVIRLGGEEFLVVCPHTSAQAGATLADDLRTQIAALRGRRQTARWTISMSFGVAERSAEASTTEALIRLADHRLYQAKRAGKNRVVST